MRFRAFLILLLAELIKWKKSQSIWTFWEIREAFTKWAFFCNFYPFSMYFGASGCQIFRKCAGLDPIFFPTFFQLKVLFNIIENFQNCQNGGTHTFEKWSIKLVSQVQLLTNQSTKESIGSHHLAFLPKFTIEEPKLIQ